MHSAGFAACLTRISGRLVWPFAVTTGEPAAAATIKMALLFGGGRVRVQPNAPGIDGVIGPLLDTLGLAGFDWVDTIREQLSRLACALAGFIQREGLAIVELLI